MMWMHKLMSKFGWLLAKLKFYKKCIYHINFSNSGEFMSENTDEI